MRDKHQKTGQLQLQKKFKYFNQDGSGGINFSEFQRAMKLMGSLFMEMQQLASFARYAKQVTNEIYWHTRRKERSSTCGVLSLFLHITDMTHPARGK